MLQSMIEITKKLIIDNGFNHDNRFVRLKLGAFLLINPITAGILFFVDFRDIA